MLPYRTLQRYAFGISVLSVLYNGAEAGFSLGFGSESSSRSLIFFGIQSGIEVISSCIVVWRFRYVTKPGEEDSIIISESDLRLSSYLLWQFMNSHLINSIPRTELRNSVLGP